MTQRTSGFALVVAMMVGLVVLIVVVTTASISTLSARKSVSNERQTYRTLLVAESGINTFAARATLMPFRGTVTQAALDNWAVCNADGSGFCFPGFGVGSNVSLAVTLVSPNRVTVASTGAIGTDSTKRVLQDFEVSAEPGPLLNLPCALCTMPNAKVKGNASINGLVADSGTGVVGDVAETTTAFSTTSPLFKADTFELSVTNTSFIDAPGYVTVAMSDGTSETFKVTEKTEDTLKLEVLNAPGTGTDVSVAAGAQIGFIPFAATGGTSGGDPSDGAAVSTVPVTSTDGFFTGMPVFIAGWSGTVSDVGADGETVEITWTGGSGSGTPIKEGDAFSRSIDDVASAGTIDVGGNALACGHESGGTGAYDPNRCSQLGETDNPMSAFSGADDLFYATFGMTLDEFNAAYPPISTWDGQADAGAVINISGSQVLAGTGGDQICGGPAVVVVQGDLTLNGSCDGGFHGFIYVTGQFSQQGNSDIYGAVAVDGTYSTVGQDTTSVTGTNNPNADGSKIEYDMSSLLQAGLAIAPRQFAAISGTWRQR